MADLRQTSLSHWGQQIPSRWHLHILQRRMAQSDWLARVLGTQIPCLRRELGCNPGAELFQCSMSPKSRGREPGWESCLLDEKGHMGSSGLTPGNG